MSRLSVAYKIAIAAWAVAVAEVLAAAIFVYVAVKP